jgi:hypothetical protein
VRGTQCARRPFWVMVMRILSLKVWEVMVVSTSLRSMLVAFVRAGKGVGAVCIGGMMVLWRKYCLGLVERSALRVELKLPGVAQTSKSEVIPAVYVILGWNFFPQSGDTAPLQRHNKHCTIVRATILQSSSTHMSLTYRYS